MKEILGELLLNGRLALQVARSQEERLDQLSRIEQEQARQLEAIEQEQGRRLEAIEQHINGFAVQVAELGGTLTQVRRSASSDRTIAEAPGNGESAVRILRLAALLAPSRAVGAEKVRVGRASDGGYVMLDDWEGVAGAVSIGIGNDDAWDLAMLDRGLRVAQFDHTITAPPSEAAGLSWQPLGIGPADVNNIRSLRSLLALSGLPAEGDLVLKMDVEAAEWPVLAVGDEATPLGRFRQILIEFHWFDRVGEREWFAAAEAGLSHLARTHAVVHVHANNWGGMALIGGIPFPRVLEVTFARRDAYAFEPETGSFPTPLDAACDPRRPDIFLGSFRFPAPRTTS